MLRLTVLLLGIALAASSAPAQVSTGATTAPSSPQAVNLLNQSISTAIGPTATSGFSDFTALGTITYYWGEKPVQGSVTVRGRGSDQFRLDANIPEGTRSWAVSHGLGALRDTDGKVTRIPYFNTINAGVLAFPYPTVAAALADPLTNVTYLGQVTMAGRVLYQVRVQRNFSTQSDPDGELSKLCVTDYFIDPQTYLIAESVDMTHPVETYAESYTHEIDLENYIIISGIQFPTLIREKISDQTTWELRLAKFTINSGLTDADFTIQ